MRPARFALLLSLALCACSSPEQIAPLDYGALGKIKLDVSELSFTDRGIDNQPQAPVINGQFSPSIADTVHNWASSRIEAVGTTGSASVSVKNAYVAEQGAAGANGWFDTGNNHKYIGHVEVEIEARGSEGYALASANATRVVPLSNDPDTGEKRDAYRVVLNGLMQDLNNYLEQAIRDHMQAFVVTAPVIPPASGVVPESPNQAP